MSENTTLKLVRFILTTGLVFLAAPTAAEIVASSGPQHAAHYPAHTPDDNGDLRLARSAPRPSGIVNAMGARVGYTRKVPSSLEEPAPRPAKRSARARTDKDKGRSRRK